ncbi:MAG: ribose-phosphate diphosphokinase [archaeon]|nr:ribose-phosphate diphosphokinase [archaeon]MCR4324017.1 ribose-phosphate diphosphokinase [Nanoarchaeota archaeon]
MEGKRGPLAVMACKSGFPFAQKIIKELNNYLSSEGISPISLIPSQEVSFANSEIKTTIDCSIRGSDLYIIQDVENSTNNLSVDENLRALKTAIDSARRADAHYITAVIPVFPYARQDKQVGRECITAAQVAREIEDAGADRVITLDVHNTAIAGFFREAKFENLRASKNILDYVKQNICLDNLIVVAPDEGGTKRASYYAQKLGVKLAIIYKERDYSTTSKIENTTLLGDVSGKDVFIIDDMISTGGTFYNISKMLKEKFDACDIYLACSLPLFNPPSIERFKELFSNGVIRQVLGTDAVSHSDIFKAQNIWYQEISVAKYFAKVIYSINNCMSLSALLS